MVIENILVRVLHSSSSNRKGMVGKVIIIFLNDDKRTAKIQFSELDYEIFSEEELEPVGVTPYADMDLEQEYVGHYGPCIFCEMPRKIKHKHILKETK